MRRHGQTHTRMHTHAERTPPYCSPLKVQQLSVLGKTGVLRSYQPGHPVVTETCQQHPQKAASRAKKDNRDMMNINTKRDGGLTACTYTHTALYFTS